MKPNPTTETAGKTPKPKSSPSLVAPFVVGSLLGAGVALLTAPHSGKKTRQILKGKARQLETQARHLQGKATKTIATAQKLITSPKKTVLAKVISSAKRPHRASTRKRS